MKPALPLGVFVGKGRQLASVRARVGEARRAPHGDKDLHRDDLAGAAVDDLAGAAGEIDQQLLAGDGVWRIVGFSRPAQAGTYRVLHIGDWVQVKHNMVKPGGQLPRRGCSAAGATGFIPFLPNETVFGGCTAADGRSFHNFLNINGRYNRTSGGCIKDPTLRKRIFNREFVPLAGNPHLGDIAMDYERRETERAIKYWQQRVEGIGYPPLKPTDLEFEDLITEDGANRFIISVDQTADDHVLLTHGTNFGRLLGLRESTGSKIRLIHEIPPRLLPAFIQGCRDVAINEPPVRVEGAIDLEGGRRQLYRAVFMPIGVNLVFGAFNSGLIDSNPRRSQIKRVEARNVRSEEAAIAAFIRMKGITRCPTAYAVPTRASITAADQAALEKYAFDRERLRRQRSAVLRLSFWAIEASPGE